MLRLIPLVLALSAPAIAQADDTCPLPVGAHADALGTGVAIGPKVHRVSHGRWRKLDRILLSCGMTESSRKLRAWRTAKQANNVTWSLGVPISLFPPALIVTIPAVAVTSVVTVAQRNQFETALIADLDRLEAPAPPVAPVAPAAPAAPAGKPAPTETEDPVAAIHDMARRELKAIEASADRLEVMRAENPELPTPTEQVRRLRMEADLLRRELVDVRGRQVELRGAIASDLRDVRRAMNQLEDEQRAHIARAREDARTRQRLSEERARSSRTGHSFLLTGAGALVLGGVTAATITAQDPSYAPAWVPTVGLGLVGAGLVGGGLYQYDQSGRTHRTLQAMDRRSGAASSE